MKKYLSVKVLTVAALIGGTILSASGPAAAAENLPSKAVVTGKGKVTNYSADRAFIPEDSLMASARETAEWSAKRQCASGEIRHKHIEVVSKSYVYNRATQTQVAEYEIRTRCW